MTVATRPGRIALRAHRLTAPAVVLALGGLCGACAEAAGGDEGEVPRAAADATVRHAGGAAPDGRAAGEPADGDAAAEATGADGSDAMRGPQRDAPARSDGGGPRVYAKTRHVWIREHPDSSLQWIGYLWHGGSAKLREPDPVAGPGCATWYAVEPRGYVCVDGERATLDPEDPVLLAVRPFSPDLSTPWPHRYAESRGAMRYRALPGRDEQRARERDLDAHLARMDAARRGEALHPSLVGVELLPAPGAPLRLESLPPRIQMPQERFLPRSTIAYTREVWHEGRSWLMTADLAWVPRDRTELYPRATFGGVHLRGEVKLPIAFFRVGGRPQYRKGPDGEIRETGRVFPRLGWVQLTGRRERSGEREYLETVVEGLYTTEEDVTLPAPRQRTPWGAEVGAEDPTGAGERRTWIQVSVLKGWLIAYEGTRPVFVTLTSSGRGGTPVPGKDPVETASTPVGRFNVTGKFATATMEAPNGIVHSDVPWTQNFSGPHALHSAYWHDDWGRLKSGGCINVSPADGRFLYAWTEPEVPPGWHAVRWDPRREASTVLVVHP